MVTSNQEELVAGGKPADKSPALVAAAPLNLGALKVEVVDTSKVNDPVTLKNKTKSFASTTLDLILENDSATMHDLFLLIKLHIKFADSAEADNIHFSYNDKNVNSIDLETLKSTLIRDFVEFK